MKRIIIACDGTGKSSNRGEYSVSSNINRLCHALKIDGNTPQIVFYQSGIGTASISVVAQTWAALSGAGIDDNILDAYQFIANNYLPGDEIFIFGFSRGAYTARVLANFIIQLGVLRTNYSWELKRAWNAYEEGADAFANYIHEMQGRTRKYDPVGKERAQGVNVKVVGCFDTVGSVAVGDFYDPSLVKAKVNDVEYKIENAFHALALDEYRDPFTPTLWHMTEGTNLEQTWFSGAHTNVGGGYADQICADLAFLWMIDRCSPFLSFDPEYIQTCIVHLHHHPEDIHSKPRSNLKGDKPFRKEYVPWGTGQIEDSFHNGIHVIGGRKYRRPGEYGSKPDSDSVSVGTMEKIHPSVRVRWNNSDSSIKMPDSLAGFVPRQRADGKWEWHRPAKARKPEVTIEEEDFTADETKWEWILRHGRTRK